MAGIIPDLPVPFLVGQDWLGFPEVALAAEDNKGAADAEGKSPGPAF